MVLGLGVRHTPVTDRIGLEMKDPVEEMRKYVAAVRSFVDGSSPLLTIKRQLPAFPIYIAALTEKAAELAGEVADGIMPYMATPDYIKKLAGAIGRGAEKAGRSPSDIDITDGIPCFISDDIDAARSAAKRGLAGYARLPFYQRLIKNIGFGEVVEKIRSGANPAEALTDELVEAVALIGSAERCRERLQAYREAGIQLPIIVPHPVGKQSNVEVMKNMIQALVGF